MADHNTVTLSDSDRGLRAAVSILRAGELVAFPTETVYGLGADARDDRAVARVYEAKGRPAFNPLIVHVHDLEAAERFAVFDPAARALADAVWPGPLTLVLPRRAGSGLSDLVTAGLPTVAIRVPAHALARRLLADFGGPLAAPSANPSGAVSPTTRAHVIDGLGGRIAAVFEGGPCPVGVESTIVGIEDGAPALLRPGGLSVEDICAVSGRGLATAGSDAITAPGQLASHYAPEAVLRLDASGPETDELWLGFGPVESLRPGLNLSSSSDTVEAASNLFSHLRELDQMGRELGLSRIAVAPIPPVGLGLAINDRLRRAAAPRP